MSSIRTIKAGDGGIGGEGGGGGGKGGDVQVNIVTASPDYRPHIIANWLSSLDFRERLTDFLEKRTEGTGQWLLESQPFCNWHAGESRILWCSGIPGAGKSFLAAIAVDHLQKLFEGKDVAVACIFCNYKERSTQSLEELVASILKQIIQNQPLASESIKAFCKEFRDKQRRPRLTNLIDALRSEIQTYSKVFFVLDALDECLEDYQGGLIDELESISSTVYLMVTSRPLDLIKQQFQGACHLDINATDGDVRKYIDSRLRIRRGQIKNEIVLAKLARDNGGLRDSIVEKIVTNTRGMFLMAKLHIDLLVSQRSAWEVRNALDNLPTEVDATYDEAMKRIQRQSAVDRKLAERVLSWITNSRRPLSYQELQHALAVTPQMTDMITEALVDKCVLIDICAGLVVIDDHSHIIRLAHYTTQEYFSNKGASLFPNAQVDMALTCLQYLSFDALEQGRGARYPFVFYAAVHWGHHARSNEVTTLDMVQKFLSRKPNVAYATTILLEDREHGLGDYRRYRTDFGAIHLLSFFGLGKAMSQINHSADSKDSRGQTPLSHAATQGHSEVVQLLLARGDVDVNSKDEHSHSPLSYAAENGHLEVTKLLLARDDINVNSKDWHSRSPLSYAAQNGRLEVTKLLLARHHIKVNSKDEDGCSPLSYAARNGHLEVTKLLLAQDHIKVNSKEEYDGSPLSYAAQNGHLEVTKLLLAQDHIKVNSKDKDSRSPLSYATDNGHLEVMKLLLAQDNVNVNSEDWLGRSPLSYAAQNGHLEVTKLLLAQDNVDVNSKDRFSPSPLSYAAQNGHSEVTKLLLAQDNVDVNSKDRFSRSPLSYAAKNGHLEVTKLLLARDDIKVNSKDEDGCSPLSYATDNGHLEVTKLLLARDDIDVNSKDNRGQSPLTYAGRCSEIVQLFMVETIMGLSSPNDIVASPAMMSPSYPQSDGTEQHPFHNISGRSTIGKRKQRSDEILVDTEKRSKR